MPRSDTIYLAPSEARCEPNGHCKSAVTCARVLASIPQGSRVESRSPAWCMAYLSVSSARKAAPGMTGAKVHDHWSKP